MLVTSLFPGQIELPLRPSCAGKSCVESSNLTDPFSRSLPTVHNWDFILSPLSLTFVRKNHHVEQNLKRSSVLGEAIHYHLKCVYNACVIGHFAV